MGRNSYCFPSFSLRCLALLWLVTASFLSCPASAQQVVVGPEFTVVSAQGEQFAFGAAFDRVNLRYLVAVSNGQNSPSTGQLLAADGTQIGGLFTLSTSPFFNAQSNTVAFDPINQRYFVVWEAIIPFVAFRQLVTADGSLFGLTSQVPVPEGTGASVAFDPTNQTYLFVWVPQISSGTRTILGQLFGSDGSPLGGNFVIGTSSCGISRGGVVFNPTASQFLVTWSECLFGPPRTELRGQFVTGTGVLVGTTSALPRPTTNSCNSEPTAAADTTRARYLVTWRECVIEPSTGLLYGLLIGGNGTPVGTPFQISQSNVQNAGSAGVGFDAIFDQAADAFLVVWTSGVDASVLAQLIRGDGSLAGSNFSIGGLSAERIVHDSVNHRVLVAYLSRQPSPLQDDIAGRLIGFVLNRPPVANAGPDQTIECSSPSGTSVTLDGSVSSDPDGDALSFEWKDEAGNVVGTTASVTLTLTLGAHTFTLTVSDGKGGTASDTVLVRINVGVAGLLPPFAALVEEPAVPALPGKAFRQGSTLPLKLQLFCGVTLLTGADVAPPQIVALTRSGEPIDLSTVDVDAGQANDNGILFRFSDGNWVYNLSTKSLVSGTYVIKVEMPDGRRFNAGFVLK